MTYDSVDFTPVDTRSRSFLAGLRRFFSEMFSTNEETAHNLPANMAARLYL